VEDTSSKDASAQDPSAPDGEQKGATSDPIFMDPAIKHAVVRSRPAEEEVSAAPAPAEPEGGGIMQWFGQAPKQQPAAASEDFFWGETPANQLASPQIPHLSAALSPEEQMALVSSKARLARGARGIVCC
jgi:hypothetical protein